MRTNGQTFDDNRTATATGLASVARVHGDALNTSFFRFVFEHLPEHAQRRVMSGQGQIAVASHESEGQIFNSDIAIAIDNPARGLMPELAPGIGDLFMQHGDLPRSLAPVGTAFLAPSHSSLGDTQSGKVGTQPARIVDDRAVRESQQVMQPHIDTNIGAAGLNRCNVGQFEHQADVPLAETALHNDVLDFSLGGDVTMKDDLHLSDVLDVEPVAFQFAPVAGPVFDRLKPLDVLESRMTGMAFVERLVSLVHAAKHLLDRRGVEHPHLVGQGMTLIAHPVPLLHVSHRPARSSPLHTTLIERVVIDSLHLAEQAIKQMLLFLRRAKPVFVRANHPKTKTVRLLLLGCHTQTGQAGRLIIYSIRLCVTKLIIAQMFYQRKETALRAALIPLPLKRGSTLRG